MGRTAVVARGRNKGVMLYPHQHEDGMYVLSTSRYERDYIRVADLHVAERGVAAGLRLRMSNQSAGITGAILIEPSSIKR